MREPLRMAISYSKFLYRPNAFPVTQRQQSQSTVEYDASVHSWLLHDVRHFVAKHSSFSIFGVGWTKGGASGLVKSRATAVYFWRVA